MDLIDFSRYFAALLVVLGLLGGVAVILRKGWLPTGLSGFQGLERRERRLAVKESLILDPRRRVVIVKSDECEHVLLLGPERETVLESRAAKAEPVFEPVAPGADPDTGTDAGTEADAGRGDPTLRAAE